MGAVQASVETPLAVAAGAASAAEGLPHDAIEVGRVLGAWGVKGWFRVQPYASDPQALISSRRWFLQAPPAAATPRPLPPPPALLKITGARQHGDGIVASAQDVPDRLAAEALGGARVFVSRASFPSAGDGEFYWVDLLGLAVVNRDGVTLGDVAELLDTGAHSVLVVRQGDVQRLIPFVAAYVDAVQLAERRINVDWGLDY